MSISSVSGIAAASVAQPARAQAQAALPQSGKPHQAGIAGGFDPVRGGDPSQTAVAASGRLNTVV